MKNMTRGQMPVKSKIFLPLAIFVAGVSVRSIPELFSGAYPVGFDTMQGYLPAIMAFPDFTPMKLFGWAYSPLAVCVLWLSRALTGADPFQLLKVAGPLFFGFFCLSFYFMLNRGLKWTPKKSSIVALLLLVQPAILRLGWDQLREEMGLGFLFLFVALTNGNVVSGTKSKLRFLSMIALSLLVVFSHQLAAILLLAVISWQLLLHKPKTETAYLHSVLFALLPFSIFVWQVYSQFMVPSYSIHFAPLQLPNITGNFVFTNYFISDPHFIDGSYTTVLTIAGSLMVYTVAILAPFALKGFFKDRVVFPIFLWLCVASFSIFVSPAYAFSQYWWWMLLLPIPLTIYAGEFLDRKHVFDGGKINRRKAALAYALVLTGILAVGYASSSIRMTYVNATTYLPLGMVESSIPFEDVQHVQSATLWINTHAQPNATVIIEERIQGFAFIELRADLRIRVSPALLSLNQASKLNQEKSSVVYAIWFNDNVDCSTLNGSRVAEFGRIGIFTTD